MHCSLSFAMQRVCFQTKRSFAAANRAAEVALNNFGRHVVGCEEERECVGRSRVAQRQQCGDVSKPRSNARAATRARSHSLRGID